MPVYLTFTSETVRNHCHRDFIELELITNNLFIFRSDPLGHALCNRIFHYIILHNFYTEPRSHWTDVSQELGQVLNEGIVAIGVLQSCSLLLLMYSAWKLPLYYACR